MSEPSPERSSGGNVLTRKIGILPMWGWAAIILGVVLLYSYRKKSQSNTAAQAAANTPGGVDASLVPQFINQEYVNTTPPAAPNVTVNNTIPNPPEDVDMPPGPVETPPPPTSIPPSPKPQPHRTNPPFEPIFNGTYTVKKGETLQQIATKFHISREQLAHANGLGTGAGLRTGQRIKVPIPAPAGRPNKAI
jgi:LysM repeat protein